MKYIFFLFIIISFSARGQELKLTQATKQTANSGASATVITNYCILLKKEKSFCWSVDSVVDVYTQKPLRFHIVKIEKPGGLSAQRYLEVKKYSKKDKGIYRVSFEMTQNRKTGPDTPMNKKVPVDDITQGVIVFYSAEKKKKKCALNRLRN